MIHQPPEWVIAESEPLSLESFQRAFGEAWSRLERRFLKVECWQSYQEAEGVRSQEAFQNGDPLLARNLLKEEARGDQPLYDEVVARNLEFSRIRLLSYPLTDYLRYEMINYEIRGQLGERIVFFLPPSPLESYFDFLLFDSSVALIHDYGPGPVGHQRGGWLTRDAKTLDALELIVDDLRARGRVVDESKPSSGAS